MAYMGMRHSPEPQGERGGGGTERSDRASTGTKGLDQVLGGGFPRDRTYLIQGASGTGKTTLGLQFLLEGVKHGERALYLTLAWGRKEIEDVLRAYRWPDAGIEIYEHAVGERYSTETRQTIFHPGDVELTETMAALLRIIDDAPGARIVVDSLVELRSLAADPLQYRYRILALRQRLAEAHSTALLLDESPAGDDVGIGALVHGIVTLGRRTTRSGRHRRWLRVEKMLGVSFHEGDHDMAIALDGLWVFPRLVMSAAVRARAAPPAASSRAAIV